MRIFSKSTLIEYCKRYPSAKQSLLSWHKETESANWKNPNELKEQFANASIIANKRVVFNIHGNSFRLIVKIEFYKKAVFVVWFGRHKEYDKIDAEKITYDD